MKLFVWEDVFCDYSCGIAVAMANTVEEARAVLQKAFGSLNWISNEIMRPPDKIHEEPAGAYSMGGG
jgi:hypothetical protein